MDGAQDGIAWLYAQGKDAFEKRAFEDALHSFELCIPKLREQHQRRGGSPGTFQEAQTGYRHLDDYLELCRTRHMATGGGGGALVKEGSPLRSANGENIRTTLIMVCSPRGAPLPHLADEAVDVANVVPSHIRRGGSAADLRSELMRQPFCHFLFSGHGDAELGPAGSSTKTLGFTSASGGLETVTPETLADVLGGHSPRRGGALTTVVLNGCETEKVGHRVREAGVPYVLCWRTKAENTAARLFACSFFSSLAAGRGHLQAYEDAKAAVRCVTRPGRLASGVQSSVPAYELRDPLVAINTVDASSEESGTATARGDGGPVRRGFMPAPMAAGIPVLLCAETEHG